jgi:hypothetical protein
MIASGQGAAASYTSDRQLASTSGSKAATESSQTNRGGRDSAGHMASQKSKSVITLSFPKEYLKWSTSPSNLMSRPSAVGLLEFRCDRHRKLGSRERRQDMPLRDFNLRG